MHAGHQFHYAQRLAVMKADGWLPLHLRVWHQRYQRMARDGAGWRARLRFAGCLVNQAQFDSGAIDRRQFVRTQESRSANFDTLSFDELGGEEFLPIWREWNSISNRIPYKDVTQARAGSTKSQQWKGFPRFMANSSQRTVL